MKLPSWRREDRAATDAIPGSASALEASSTEEEVQRELWRLAGITIADSPADSAPRLYVETLNEMIDMQTVRVSALTNRVPGGVLLIEIVGAAVALGLLAFYFALLSRGVLTVFLAATFVSVLLFITFDLDRPTRGFVRVPDTPLQLLRESMALPPSAEPPASR